MAFLSLLWRYRVTLIISAVLAAVVGAFFALTGPQSLTTSGQLLLPAVDPVSAQTGNQNKPDNSIVGIRVKAYADGGLGDDVRRALGADAKDLDTFSATRQRDPLFWKVSAGASIGRVAKAAVQAGADALVKKEVEIGKAQLDALQKAATDRIAPLDQQAAAASADQVTRQASVDHLNEQIKSIQGQIDSANNEAARAAVSGRGGTSPSSLVTGLQGQITELTKQLIPAQVALEQAKSKFNYVNAQRTGIADQVQKATDTFVSMQVTSSLATPPPKPQSTKKLQLVTLVGLEVVVSLAVAAGVISWQERRQISRLVRAKLGRPERPEGRGRRSRRGNRGLSGIAAPAGAHGGRRR